MTAVVGSFGGRRQVVAAGDCGLCTHGQHTANECEAVNEFGRCCCWCYMPVAVYETRCAA